jgi:Universal stress protein family
MLERYQSKAKMLSLKSVNIIQARGNSVAQEILQISDKENVDTIVVGRRGRYISSNNEILLGSTSYMLTHYAKCIVVVVKLMQCKTHTHFIDQLKINNTFTDYSTVFLLRAFSCHFINDRFTIF